MPVTCEKRTGQNLHVAEFDPDEIFSLADVNHPFWKTSEAYVHKFGSRKRAFRDPTTGTVYIVQLKSPRYPLFARSRKCVCCGIEGTKLMLDVQPSNKCKGHRFQQPHFNLYAVKPDGTLLLMTKDHKVPKAKGGTDDLDNLQTMCTKCNERKKDRNISIEELRKKMGITS